LVHNTIAPHSSAFYQLLDKVWIETQEFVANGYTGVGFYSKGNTLLTSSPMTTTGSKTNARPCFSPRQAAIQAAMHRSECVSLATSTTPTLSSTSCSTLREVCEVCESFIHGPRITCEMCLSLKPSRFLTLRSKV
ncbi:hypothetical protein HMI55_005369, partial [Coelomomyces lativittatus]